MDARGIFVYRENFVICDLYHMTGDINLTNMLVHYLLFMVLGSLLGIFTSTVI